MTVVFSLSIGSGASFLIVEILLEMIVPPYTGSVLFSFGAMVADMLLLSCGLEENIFSPA